MLPKNVAEREFNHAAHAQAEHNISNADDVDYSAGTPTTGQVLGYDQTTGLWSPISAGGSGGLNLDGLGTTDVRSTIQWWTWDPGLGNTTQQLAVTATTGKLLIVEFRLSEAISPTKVALYTVTADVTQGATYFGLYAGTATGALLCSTPSLGGVGGALRTAGYAEVAFSVAPGELAAGKYYAAFLVDKAVAGTDDDAAILALSEVGNTGNLGLTDNTARKLIDAVGYNTLPASLPGTQVGDSTFATYWFGLV
jgi:hypothetical protein